MPIRLQCIKTLASSLIQMEEEKSVCVCVIKQG